MGFNVIIYNEVGIVLFTSEDLLKDTLENIVDEMQRNHDVHNELVHSPRIILCVQQILNEEVISEVNIEYKGNMSSVYQSVLNISFESFIQSLFDKEYDDSYNQMIEYFSQFVDNIPVELYDGFNIYFKSIGERFHRYRIYAIPDDGIKIVRFA